MPCAIFQYRDEHNASQFVDQEVVLPLQLYKGLFSVEALKADYLSIVQASTSFNSK